MNFAGHLVSRLGPESRLVDTSSGEELGRGDLGVLIAQSSAAFTAAGLQPGDKVILICDLNPTTALAYLGAIHAGLVAVPINSKVHKEKLFTIVNVTEAKALWSLKSFAATSELAKDLVIIEGRLFEKTLEKPSAEEMSDSDLAALMMTSGSTSEPRFVMVTHGNLAANTEAIVRSQHLEGSGEMAMLVMPMNYAFGASVLHSFLWAGGGVAFDRRFMFPDKVLQAIGDSRCTTFAGVPSAYSLLLNHSSLGTTEMPGLRRFIQAGGAMPVKNIERLRKLMPSVDLYVMYGQTEATARITCLPPTMLDSKCGSVGLPLDNLRVEILDENDQVLPDNKTGEIYVNGPSVSPGYWNSLNHEEAFWNDGLRTGDIGYRDADGVIWITGRKGDFVKMSGHRVSLSEVVSLVHSNEGVNECGAVRVLDPDSGEAVSLFVTSSLSSDELPDLEKRIRKGMLPHWVCDRVEFVGELPRNSNGKVSRSVLEDLAQELGVL